MAQLYIATQTFMSNHRDREVWVTPGQIAEKGSWVLDTSPESFKELAIDYPAPGSKFASQKPAQQHPQRLADAEPTSSEPPAVAPDAGQVAQTDGRKLPEHDNPMGGDPEIPAPDSGMVAHKGDKPQQRNAPVRRHKPARKA